MSHSAFEIGQGWIRALLVAAPSLTGVCSESITAVPKWTVILLMVPSYLILLPKHIAICYRNGTLIVWRGGRERPEGPSNAIASRHTTEGRAMPGCLPSPELRPLFLNRLSISTGLAPSVLLVTSLKQRWVLHAPDDECYFILYGARSYFWMKRFSCEEAGRWAKKYIYI